MGVDQLLSWIMDDRLRWDVLGPVKRGQSAGFSGCNTNEKPTMPKARIPQIDPADNRLAAFATELAQLASLRCSKPEDFTSLMDAAKRVIADAMWLVEQKEIEAMCTTDAVIEVAGEPYRRLSQASSRVYHGLWGAHEIHEPLYRRADVHNGPTLKPLDARLGVVDHALLPDLANAAGAMMADNTSRHTERTLQRLGFRPPSRAVLEKRVGHMFDDMAVVARELEEQCRQTEQLDFEPVVITVGLDRFAARMDEELAEGSQRDEKLGQRRPPEQYQRTPPEPYTRVWRMAWAGSLTLYDANGHARKSFRYGTSANEDMTKLAARMGDDVLALLAATPTAIVSCIQDGALDLDPLRRELDERLPATTKRRDLVDFHHAIAYLDAIVSAKGDGDPHDLAGWYRLKLLRDDDGAAAIVEHLRREQHEHRETGRANVLAAITAALTYFEKRRPHMAYAEARAANGPVGSGATESTCGLFQLRVKHPGSHWGPHGLRGVMHALAFKLSDRWDAAFAAHHANLRQEVRAA